MFSILDFLLLSIGLNLLLFIPAFIFKTDKLTDMSYSLSFISIILLALFSKHSIYGLIVTVMVLLWSLRLGLFLVVRIWNMKKDKRFDGMREHFILFLRFWLLQGVAVWIILLPALFFITSSSAMSSSRVCWLGLFIWASGLLIESIADIQKFKFNAQKKNKGKFISRGVWKYSRHPNYFGEILCWVGLYVFVFPSLEIFQRFSGALSPFFIILLLLFVTGIPLLEKSADEKWGKQKEYQLYKHSTSVLIPWFHKHKK